MNNTIGNNIKKLRDEMGLSQQQLAESLNVGRETVTRWENGTRDIKSGSIIDLARFFNVTSDYLLGLSNSKTLEGAEIEKNIGLSEDNVNWLKENAQTYNGITNAAQKKFFGILNSILNALREEDIISKLIHLFVQVRMFKKNFNNGNISDSPFAFVESLSLFSMIIHIDEETEETLSLLTNALQSIIGYDKKDLKHYCSELDKYKFAAAYAPTKDFKSKEKMEVLHLIDDFEKFKLEHNKKDLDYYSELDKYNFSISKILKGDISEEIEILHSIQEFKNSKKETEG